MIAGRQLSLNILYRILNMVTVFGLTILLSRLCGVAGYGLFSLLIANVALFSLFSAAGSDAGITYHVASGNSTARKVLRFTARMLLLQLIAAGAAEWFVYRVTGHYFFLHVNTWAEAWPGLFLFVTLIFTEKCTAWLLGKKEYTRSNRILFVSNLLMLTFFAYAWLSGMQASPVFYIRAWALLSGIQAVWMLIACLPYLKETEGPIAAQTRPVSIYTYALFSFVINSIQFLAYRVDFWILEHFKGEQQLGWYALAVKLSQLFWVLPLLLASVIFPHAASGLRSAEEGRMQAWLRIMNGLNLAGALILSLAAAWIIPLLFGDAYRESVQLFRILLPGVLLFCIATLLAAYFGGRNELLVNLWGSVLCLLVIGSLDLILIPSKGMRGAAIASTIGYSVTGIYFLIQYCVRTKRSVFSMLLPGKSDLHFLKLNVTHDGSE